MVDIIQTINYKLLDNKLEIQVMEAIAKLKNVPTSPQKMRQVADLVRGKQVNQALAILKFQSKSGAPRIEKLLLSAVANWQQKYEEVMKIEDADLYVKTIFVDGGAMLKRLRPAPQGRGHRIRKRSNHVTLIVSSASNIQVDKVESTEA